MRKHVPGSGTGPLCATCICALPRWHPAPPATTPNLQPHSHQQDRAAAEGWAAPRAEMLLSPGGFNFQRDKHVQGKCRHDPAGLGWDSTPCISVTSQVVALRAPVGAEGGLGAGRETLWLPTPRGVGVCMPNARSQVKTPGRLRSQASQGLQRLR